MKKYLIVFLFGVLLLVSACGDINQNNDINDNPNNEVNDSNNEDNNQNNEQNDNSNNEIEEESKFIEGNIFESYVENTKNDTNYKFQANLDLGSKNNKKVFTVNMWEEYNGVIKMQNYYSSGESIYNGSINYSFYRIEYDKTMIFDNVFNSYVPGGLVKKKEMNTGEFFTEDYEVIYNIISNQYLNVLKDATEYKEETVACEPNCSTKYIKHYKIKNTSFNINELIYYDWFKENLNYVEIDEEDIIYDIYIDVINNRVLEVELDLSDYLETDQYEKFIIGYSYSDFGTSNIGLPFEFNYYSKPSQELLDNFNSLFEDSLDTLRISPNLAFTTTIKGKEDANNGGGYSPINSVKNYYLVDDEEMVYYLNIENLIDYAYTVENGSFYKYIVLPEGDYNYSGKIVKKIITENEAFIDSKMYIPIINKEKIRSYTMDVDGINYTIYETSVLGSDLLETSPAYRSLIESKYADKYSTEMKEEGTYDVSNLYVDIKLVFNTEDRTLVEIDMDLEDLILEMVEFKGQYEVSEFNFKVTYNYDNQFDIDKSFMENAEVDNEADTFVPIEQLTPIIIDSETNGTSQLSNDIDLFSLSLIDNSIIDVNVSESNFIISIYDLEHNLIDSNSGYVNCYLEAGDYYLSITSKISETTDYTVTVQTS